MKNLIILLCFLIISNFTFSQPELNLDSLNNTPKNNINLDSLLINLSFGKAEDEFIEKIIKSRNYKTSINLELSKQLIDSLCQGILKLDKTIASDFRKHSKFTNTLINQAIKAVSLSKGSSDITFYQQSKLLLRLSYICRNYAIYFEEDPDAKINNDIIDYKKDSGVVIRKNNKPASKILIYKFVNGIDYSSLGIDDFKYKIDTHNDTIKILTENSDPVSDEMILFSQLFKHNGQGIKGVAIHSVLLNLNFFKHDLDVKYEERRTSNQKRLTILFIITTIISILAIILSIVNIIKRKKLFKIVNIQKKEIETKNHEIISSIDYSKRIQTAILPDVKDIDKSIGEYFILYKPKDIVSGDFYYFNKIDNDVFIAAADCTGHGVPGAFMSLIGSKELKIANTKTSSPSEILTFLNNGIKETLKQNHVDGTRDGMDIALVKINGNQITYSGANRPLWISKNNASELEEIKATKSAIAGFTVDDYKFEEHVFNLNTGDCIYLFSDGYVDQFGGEKLKKLTVKRFREYLLSIKHLPMKEQCQLLDTFFENWKSDNEQVDDILIIGIRL